MFNNLFAFNISQETPQSEILSLNTDAEAEYDAQRQVWIGTSSVQGTCCGSYVTTANKTHYCTVGYPQCGSLDGDPGSDYVDCE